MVFRCSALLCALASVMFASSVPGQPRAAGLTMAAFLEGKWTYQPRWSPDGRYIAFVWDDWVRQDIYVVPAEGGTPAKVSNATSYIGNPSFGSAGEAPSWSPDSKEILYAQDGDLFVTTVPGGQVTRLTDTDETETGGRFAPDGRRIAFSRGGNLYTLDRASGSALQVNRGQGGAGAAAWSPDGKWIAVERGASTWVSWTPDYSGTLVSYNWSKRGTRDVGVVSAGGGPIRWIGATPDNEAFLDWSPDSRSILLERRTQDVKERTMFLATIADGALQAIYKQRDEKFLPSNDQHAMFSPDGRSVAFTSDADGWNHLYLIDLPDSQPRQLTKGPFEVSFPTWLSDGQSIVYCSTEVATEQRHVYTVSRSGQQTRITTQPGVNTAAAPSPSGTSVLFLRSDPTHLPDLWVAPLKAGGDPRQLSDALTPMLKAFPWQTPQIVTFPSSVDGTPIKAQLFKPPNFDRRLKYPAIVHTHQAAIYQEVYLGPGPQKDNVAWYGFHQRLAQEGYVVLNVDYRGSYGYGRNFRVGDYMDLGGNDARDVISGVEHLRSLGFVDMDRLGVYGMSYGGHMTLSLVTKFPDVFKAGVDIAGVADFTLNYESLYGPWILGRLGTPEQNPDAYFQASAINFLDRLKAPLLILHGTNDPNVTLLQSVMLVDRLLKLGKTFEFEIYPGEIHFFTKRRSWVDAFGKMEKFFAQYVKDRRSPSSSSAQRQQQIGRAAASRP